MTNSQVAATEPEQAAATATGDAGRARRHSGLGAGLLVVGVTVLVSLFPLLFNPHFYFFADTPDGAYGQWYELGQQLRAGNWPMVNPAAWMAGNYIAEGQWGLWNPVVLLIGLFVSVVPSAVVASTTVKVVFLALGALGSYVLLRTHGTSRRWCVVAATATPVTGFTLFMDASSWVTNLMTWALFLWAAAALRIWARRGGWWSLAALAACYLLITVGYVQGTIMLVLFFAASLVEAALTRSWPAARRLLGVGVSAGLVAIAVYLPGVLTAPVTARASGIANDGFLVVTLTSLFSSIAPSGQSDLTGWWGRFTEVPLVYIWWMLPILGVLDWSAVRRRWREVSGLGVFVILALALALGPSQLGPLRFPARTLPWVATGLILLVGILMARSGGRVVVTRARVTVVLAVVAGGYWLAFAQFPSAWKVHGAFGLLTTVALVVLLVLCYRSGRFTRFAAAAAVVTMVAVVTGQSAIYAERLVSRAPYTDAVQDYASAMPTGHGEGVVVGSALGLPEDAFAEVDFANMWYLTDGVSVLNLYTPVEHRELASDLCLAYDGRTCYELLDDLFDPDAATGTPLVDLMSLDSVQVIADVDHPLAELAQRQPPSGWSRSFVGNYSVVWTRDVPTPAVGGVTWASPGVEVSQLSESPTSVTFRVDDVAEAGGTVVLSRVAWPGYAVEGGALADPLRGYLLTIDVPGASVGDVVTVTFRPPAWQAIVGAMVVAWLLGAALGWASWRPLRRESARRPGAGP